MPQSTIAAAAAPPSTLTDFDLYLFAEIFRLCARSRYAHDYRLAHKAHLAMRKRRACRDAIAGHRIGRDDIRHSIEVGADEHRAFAV